MKRIAIFASGTGSNARRIMEYFQHHPSVEVALLASNRSTAPVLAVAERFGIDRIIFDRERFYDGQFARKILREKRIDFVVLAGFLWRVPEDLVQAYSGRMINIHPALLPRYGGKGMYGMHVHRAVRESGDSESGISIHWVNEAYDEGALIFQASCAIAPEDSPEDIAAKVQRLEHRHFAPVIERLLL